MSGAFPAVYDFDAALAYLGEANAAEVFEREVRSFTRSFVRSSVRPSRLRTYLLGKSCGMVTAQPYPRARTPKHPP